MVRLGSLGVSAAERACGLASRLRHICWRPEYITSLRLVAAHSELRKICLNVYGRDDFDQIVLPAQITSSGRPVGPPRDPEEHAETECGVPESVRDSGPYIAVFDMQVLPRLGLEVHLRFLENLYHVQLYQQAVRV